MADSNISAVGYFTSKLPEVRQAGQTQVCNFTIGVHTSEKDSSGNYITNFYEVSWFGGKLMDYVVKNAKKGAPVFVSGEPVMYSYPSQKTGGVGYGLRLKASSVSIPRMGTGAAEGKPAAAVNNDDMDIADL